MEQQHQHTNGLNYNSTKKTKFGESLQLCCANTERSVISDIVGFECHFASQDSTAVLHFWTISSSTTVGQIIHNNYNCFIPQSCWILYSDWSESADQFSDSGSNRSRWLFSVCCRVLVLTCVEWLDPFKEMNLSLLKGKKKKKKCHCSDFAEKGKWQCYWRVRVSRWQASVTVSIYSTVKKS